MIRRLRALRRVLEFACCDLAIVWPGAKPRSQATPDWLRNYRPDKPKFTGHGGQMGDILSDIKQFDAEGHDSWNPHEGSANGQRRA